MSDENATTRRLAEDAKELVEGAWIVPQSDILKLAAATLRMVDYLDQARAELAQSLEYIKTTAGALTADTQRLIDAAQKAGVMYCGCDTPDSMADEIIIYRTQLEAARANIAHKNDAIDSYAEFYQRAASLAGLPDDCNPSAAADEIILHKIAEHDEIAVLRVRISELVEQADATYAPYREMVMAARAETDKYATELAAAQQERDTMYSALQYIATSTKDLWTRNYALHMVDSVMFGGPLPEREADNTPDMHTVEEVDHEPFDSDKTAPLVQS